MSARRSQILVSLLLIILVVAAYAPVARYDFVSMDDWEYVKANPQVSAGLSWAVIKYAFTHIVSGNWHPLTVLSHALDCQIFGVRPGAHHLVNVMLHAVNTVLLFFLLTEMMKYSGGGMLANRRSGSPAGKSADSRSQQPQPSSIPASQSYNFWGCALVAALFGLHPLHVESVAWISERKDLLSAFFFLLTLLAYSGYARSKSEVHTSAPRIFLYLLALTFFALGLMCKPMLVTLPFVLLLFDFWPLGRVTSPTDGVQHPNPSHTPRSPAPPLLRLFAEKLPFFALAAGCCIVTVATQKSAGAVVSIEGLSLKARAANAVVSYVRYLGKAVWPGSLAIIYPFDRVPAWQVVAAAIFLTVISVVLLRSARRRPWAFVGWFMFVGMLVPVIGLVQVGSQAMADRYTYLPLIGLFIVIAWYLAELPPSWRRFAAFGSAAAVLALAIVASIQVRHWANTETLFQHCLKVTKHNSQAHCFLGALADSEGRMDEAFSHFSDAVRDNPGSVRGHCGLGYLLAGQNRLDEAAREYQAALTFHPGYPKALVGLADVLMKQHRFDEAMEQYLLALQSQPNIPQAHYQLAILLSGRKDFASAISHLQLAVQFAPDWALAVNNLAWALATQSESSLRNGAEATRLAARAVSLTDGNNPNTLDTLAAAYAETGHFTEAVQAAESAIEKAAAAGETNLVTEITSHLKVYQNRQAIRE